MAIISAYILSYVEFHAEFESSNGIKKNFEIKELWVLL